MYLITITSYTGVCVSVFNFVENRFYLKQLLKKKKNTTAVVSCMYVELYFYHNSAAVHYDMLL